MSTDWKAHSNINFHLRSLKGNQHGFISVYHMLLRWWHSNGSFQHNGLLSRHLAWIIQAMKGSFFSLLWLVWLDLAGWISTHFLLTRVSPKRAFICLCLERQDTVSNINGHKKIRMALCKIAAWLLLWYFLNAPWRGKEEKKALTA